MSYLFPLVPSGIPQPHLEAERTLGSLSVRWHEPLIMKTNGIITGYMIKWMKHCEYLRLMTLPEMDDCARVIPEGTKNFTIREVSSDPRHSIVTSLDPYTWYRFEFCAKTVKGYGPCSNITYQTDETGILHRKFYLPVIYYNNAKFYVIILLIVSYYDIVL